MFFSLHSEFLAEAGTPASNPVDVEIDLTGNESDTSRRSDILCGSWMYACFTVTCNFYDILSSVASQQSDKHVLCSEEVMVHPPSGED